MVQRRSKNGGISLPLSLLIFIIITLTLSSSSFAFQSDELLQDDEEFGLEGGVRLSHHHSSDPNPIRSSSPRKRSSSSDLDSDSKVQFTLEHAFGDSDFTPAGTFTARLKTWNHGGQSLTKLRFSRNTLTDSEKENFNNLLKDDEFYTIRLPSNVLTPPGKDYIISSVKARCLPKESLDEHFVIHMDGVNILAVNYGSPGACQYPRPLRLPKKWSFNSYTILKSSEQAPRAPAFTEDILGGEIGEGDIVPPPERSFWAKYMIPINFINNPSNKYLPPEKSFWAKYVNILSWMYMIPLGLIVVNAVTQAMNMPEEQAAGQAPQSTGQRAPSSAVRRR